MPRVYGASDRRKLGRMRAMFSAYWVFILLVFALCFYVGIADR